MVVGTLKNKISKILDVNNIGKNRFSTSINYFIIFLIVFSAIETIFKSKMQHTFGQDFMSSIDTLIYSLFSIEFLLRLYVASEENEEYKGFYGRVKYLFSFYTLIDFLAIAPFYIEMIYPGLGFISLTVLRVFRLVRLIRYLNSFNLILNAIKNKKTELYISMQLILLLTFVLSVLMFQVEHKVQPNNFKNVWDSFLWSLSKYIGEMAGYGKFSPVTSLGMLLGTIVGILGIAIFAVPAGIIASGFIEEIQTLEKNKRLAEIKRKIDFAFTKEYYAPVIKIKRELGLIEIPRRWLTIDDLIYKVGVTEQQATDFITSTDGYRIRNTKVVDNPEIGLEKWVANRSYGTCIRRDSNLVFINLYSGIQSFFGHYTSSMAFVANANYISNEKYSKATLKEGAELDFNEGINSESIKANPPFAEFIKDLNDIVDANSTCVLFIAAHKSVDMLHFNGGGPKGQSGFDNFPLFNDLEKLKDVYSDCEQFCISLNDHIKTNEVYGDLSQENTAWYIKRKFQCDVLLIHLNTQLFNNQNQSEYYRNLNDLALRLKKLA